MQFTKKKVITIVILLVIGLVSEFAISEYATDGKNYKHTIESLDEKKSDVLKLTAAAAAASAAIAAVPGDATTPIAEKVSDVSSYLLVVLATILLEKYMLTLAGALAFKVLIPLFCLLMILYVIMNKEWLAGMAKKMLILGIVIVLVVPLSVTITDYIEDTNNVSKEITALENEKDEVTTEETEKTEKEDTGLIASIESLFSDIGNKVTETTTEAIDKAATKVNEFFEGVAIMLVTSCLIPILVFIFLLWFVKMIFNIDTSKAKPNVLAEKVSHKNRKIVETVASLRDDMDD